MPNTASAPLPLCVQNAQRFDVKTSASTQSDLRKMIKQGFLTKCVEVRIVIPEVQKSIRHRIKAKRGEYINRAGIEQVLKQECDNCVKHLPQYDFRIVVFSPNRFNLIGEVKGLHPSASVDAEHSASCDAEDGRGTSTPIDSPASAAFPTDETRSQTPLEQMSDAERFQFFLKKAAGHTTGFVPSLSGEAVPTCSMCETVDYSEKCIGVPSSDKLIETQAHHLEPTPKERQVFEETFGSSVLD